MARQLAKQDSFRVVATGDDEATIYLYTEIDPDDYWGISARTFVKALNEITASVIHLRINSPGGAVFDGVAMFNGIKQHAARVIVHVDGLAASAASYVAMAGDEIIMSKGSYLMIHNAWAYVAGDAVDMRSTADMLEKINTTIATFYAEKTGKSIDEFLEMMAAETWFTGDEAVEIGLADREDETEGALNKASVSGLVSDKAPAAFMELVKKLEDGGSPPPTDLKVPPLDNKKCPTRAPDVVAARLRLIELQPG